MDNTQIATISFCITVAFVVGAISVGMAKELPEITPGALQQICNNI